ncbi:Panacea domain-containing protein [Aeromonas salmonicida]|uniref:Panacea domain-containing protein n=1 Tax=Aeromonas salmonicida TaxID=645 RepID=UPI003CEFDC5B
MANVLDVAEKFIRLGNEDEGISNLKLQKLVYYAQGYYLALYGEPLFDDDIEAWAHGPVVPFLYHEFKDYGSDSIESLIKFNEHTCLTKHEIAHIEEIYDVFGQFSAWKLRNMTHEESPWIKHESRGGVISKRELERYFQTRID